MTTFPPSRTLALLTSAGNAYNAGDMKRAYELGHQLTELEPENAEAHFIAGLAAYASRRTRTALGHFRKAARLDDRRADYAVQLARALCEDRQIGDALVAANHALGLAPSNPVMLDNLGWVYQQANAHERALSVFRQAVARAPDNAICRFNLALALQFTNSIADAERELNACLRLAPEFWRVYAMRSKLIRQTPEKNHIEPLEALLSRFSHDPEAVYYLHMALGKEHEDLGRYREAFEHLARGKAAIRRHLAYDPGDDASLVDALIEAFADTREGDACMSDEPIFVVGMPRSGTTLVERILSSHPEVHAAGELENFPTALNRLVDAPPDTPLDAARVRAGLGVDPRVLGERYISGTRPMTSMMPRFVDKRPHNFLYLGFIARALPRARIVCLRRDPVDTCLSNFREAFNPDAATHHYAFDLLDTGRYYLQFERLMAHWKRVLPGRILEIGYEDIVHDQDRATHHLLDYCELPWNDRCLHFERNTAASATASSVQVRSPLYRNAIGRWHRYEEQTRDLRQLLEASGVRTDASPG